MGKMDGGRISEGNVLTYYMEKAEVGDRKPGFFI